MQRDRRSRNSLGAEPLTGPEANDPRATRADESWRLLELGIPREDILRVRELAVLTAKIREAFQREFGRDGAWIAEIFCEASRQLELKLVSVDIQALAAGLGWPYATAHRRCLQLQRKGHLVLRKAGRHTAVTWTDETLLRIMNALRHLTGPA